VLIEGRVAGLSVVMPDYTTEKRFVGRSGDEAELIRRERGSVLGR
jgi:hypothetical protein